MPTPHFVFQRHFGDSHPTRLVRAPGRVNLIGDHIDYNGLSVLPMAVQRELRLVFRPRTDGKVRIASTAGGFGLREFSVSHDVEPYDQGDWGNYVKAAARGVVREYQCEVGIDAVVDSNIPVASGMSSSSALVIAVALALLDAADVTTLRTDLMATLARAERFVGTAGGGMDQAVCLGGRAGAATRIDFDPIRVTPFDIPPDWVFFVVPSLIRAEKSGRARTIYNRRTMECREALTVVAESGCPWPCGSYRELLGAASVAEIVAFGERCLSADLLWRFRHVVTEADRVRRGCAALNDAGHEAFGRLMIESHESLRDDYEVSTPELDRLVGLAMESGAAGARLTGAGLGGCVLGFCTPDRSDDIAETIRKEYFGADASLEPHEQVFAVTPSAGATIGDWVPGRPSEP